ncbi:unnamed protein product [Schistosoma rodhaini]|uniref:Uncharacterized protein n=1 Tax=Schistosoma rodhaini TaxID=6188 RepID=A0AA85F469_9TREM|nr:unnamed protein product [Schistosoma rodhaini]
MYQPNGLQPTGSRPNSKNISMALQNKDILSGTMLYPTHRKGGYEDTLRSTVARDGHYNHHVSRPTISQTVMNQRASWLPSNALNIKPTTCNSSHHFHSGEDGILGYAPSTQPQLAGACLDCPLRKLIQNNDFFGLQKSLVPLALQFAQAIAHTIRQTH